MKRAVFLLAALAVAPVHATEYPLGAVGGTDITADLRFEASEGLRVRMQDRAPDMIGKTNLDPNLCGADGSLCAGVAGNARYLAAPGSISLDTDNGDLNYNKHEIVAATSRLSTKFGLSWGDYGLFTRGIFYYDPINAQFDETHPNARFQPATTPRANAAKGDIAKRFDLMEAYVYGTVPLWHDYSADIRVGRQVVYWGESNYKVLNSINVWNPPDANRVEFSGSNVDEYFTPVPMVLVNTKLTDAIKLQLIYEFGWEPVQFEPAGTYLATDDTIGSGAYFAHLGAQTGEDPRDQTRPNAPLSNSGRTFYRLPDVEPKGGGQYGASMKYFAENLGQGAEFGLYFANYHSRIPSGSFMAAQATSCNSAPAVLDGTPAVAPFCLSGEPAPVDTMRYFLEYPEDVQMYGATATTTYGVWSFQAEYAYRPNLPVQIDSVDLVYAALQPALPRQTVNLGAVTIPGAREGAPDYVETLYRHHTVQPGQYIRGYEKLKVGQLNLSTIRLTADNPFGATQWLTLIEAGLTHVVDMPSLDQIQFEGPGTNNHYSPGIDGTGSGGQTNGNRLNETMQFTGFATRYAYGYNVYSELTYSDVFLGLGLKPNLFFSHDVKGVAVGNGGNFIEGRKEVDLGLAVIGKSLWSAQIVYVWYLDGGAYNLIRDRDNILVSAVFNF